MRATPILPPAARPALFWRALRWLVLVGVVALLHLLAAVWVARQPRPVNPPETRQPPVEVALLTAQPIERQTPPTSHAEPGVHAGQPPARPRAAPTSTLRAVEPTRVPKPAADAVLSAASASASDVPAASAPATDTPASTAAHTATAPSAAAAGGAPAAAASQPGDKFALPPSADLQYDTFFNGVENQSGTIHWQQDGQHYRMVVALPLPFIGTFTYASTGHIDAYGLAPDSYTEQRGRRAPDITTFKRAEQPPTISFTRHAPSLPLPAGVQDRFSVVMQLASLVRGAPNRYTPGVTTQFAVVDNDSGEIWPIEMIGVDTVRTRAGEVDAVHFMRLARRASDRRRIDIWLAESLGWLPVRIVQTEPNGTQIELLWRGSVK